MRATGRSRDVHAPARPLTWSAVDCGHVRLVVALAGGRREVVEPLDLPRAQLDAVGSGVLCHPGSPPALGCRLARSRMASTAPPATTVVKRWCSRRAWPARRPGRCPAPIRATPATPRPRPRARARRRAVEHHPAPAGACESRHDVDLPAGDRHGRDHRHRPRQARADVVRHRGTAFLRDPIHNQRARRKRSRCPPGSTIASRTTASVTRSRRRPAASARNSSISVV